MSSSPKYSEVDVVGEAARTLARQVEASYRRAAEEWEQEMRRRREERIEQERSQIHLTAQRLSQQMQAFAGQPDADVLGTELAQLHDRLSRCSTARPADLSSAQSLLKELNRIERALNTSHRRLEAVRFARSLDGVSRQVQSLKAEWRDLDSRDSERFDPGALAAIIQSVAMLERDIARKHLKEAEAGLATVRKDLDAHVERVQAGRDERDRNRQAAEQAIATTTDRFEALRNDAGLAQHLAEGLTKLQPDLQVLGTLLATEQFANLHQQVSRLNGRLDQITTTARSRIEQIEKQKLITAQLISVITSARGVLLAGHPTQQTAGPATVRFQIERRGILEVTIGLEGPISIRATGFQFEQRLARDGKITRHCDAFVQWFDELRELARAQGLDVGPLRWDLQPIPGQQNAVTSRRSRSRVTRHPFTRSMQQ